MKVIDWVVLLVFFTAMNDFTENPKYAFVVAEFPKNEYGERDTTRWADFLGSEERSLVKSEGVTKIHDNIWLIPLETRMNFLLHIMKSTTDWRIPLRILFLNAEPNWLQYPVNSDKKKP